MGYHKGELVFSDFPEREPRFIFFTHWNWKVPSDITSKYTCVNFHMTDLPYGRGGSPLQGLISRGHVDTVVTAHRMTDRLDEGDMYLKRPLSLHGTAEEIYLRAQYAVADMIKVILEINAANCLVPLHCSGMQHPVFKRRTPAQSEIPIDLERLDQVYDHARMLDADTYPRAYVDVGRFRFEFSGAVRYMDEIRASVVIRERK